FDPSSLLGNGGGGNQGFDPSSLLGGQNKQPPNSNASKSPSGNAVPGNPVPGNAVPSSSQGKVPISNFSPAGSGKDVPSFGSPNAASSKSKAAPDIRKIPWQEKEKACFYIRVETISKSGIFGATPPLGGTYGPISISLIEPPPGWNETRVDSISGSQKVHTSSSICNIKFCNWLGWAILIFGIILEAIYLEF
ncbi:14770_t:CDS:2, partial [Racocetra persica]